MIPWWIGIPAAQATISCGTDAHMVRWQAGELIAVDHNDAGPRGASDGQSSPCLRFLRAWSRRSSDPHVLTLASRGPADPLDIDLDSLRFVYNAPRQQTEQEILTLLAADGRLPDRLQATTAAIWTRRLQTGHAALSAARPQLEAALYARALRALRAWLGDPRLTVTLAMTEPDEPRKILRTAEGINVWLPFSWLSEVWIRGLAITHDRLCLNAKTTDGSSWTLTTPGPDLADPTRLTITTP